MKVVDMYLTPNKYSRPQKKLTSVRGIVWHWVANANSSAKGNRNFFENRKNGKSGYGSAHYIIDLDGTIIRCLPENEMAYHVGSHVYTKRALNELGSYPNGTTIGIECTHIDNNGKMTKETYDALIELTADLLKRNKLNTDDIWLHYETNGWKDCHRWFHRNPAEYTKAKQAVADLMSGKKVTVSAPKPIVSDDIVAPAPDFDGYYEVKKGDTLWGISQALDMTVAEIEKLNPDVKATSLSVGQRIKVKEVKAVKYANVMVGRLKTNVWLHRTPDIKEDSRIKVLEQGSYKVYGEVGEMYNVGAGFVSKEFVDLAGRADRIDLPSTVLRQGSRGTEVTQVQRALNQLGFNAGAEDGIFGTGTYEALRRFQSKNGLTIDGVYGSASESKMEALLNA